MIDIGLVGVKLPPTTPMIKISLNQSINQSPDCSLANVAADITRSSPFSTETREMLGNDRSSGKCVQQRCFVF
jgi:hypothetical protein